MSELPNKGMKLSKPGDSGGSWSLRSGIIESGFAAYAQCSADPEGGTMAMVCYRPSHNGVQDVRPRLL